MSPCAWRCTRRRRPLHTSSEHQLVSLNTTTSAVTTGTRRVGRTIAIDCDRMSENSECPTRVELDAMKFDEIVNARQRVEAAAAAALSPVEIPGHIRDLGLNIVNIPRNHSLTAAIRPQIQTPQSRPIELLQFDRNC